MATAAGQVIDCRQVRERVSGLSGETWTRVEGDSMTSGIGFYFSADYNDLQTAAFQARRPV